MEKIEIELLNEEEFRFNEWCNIQYNWKKLVCVDYMTHVMKEVGMVHHYILKCFTNKKLLHISFSRKSIICSIVKNKRKEHYIYQGYNFKECQLKIEDLWLNV